MHTVAAVAAVAACLIALRLYCTANDDRLSLAISEELVDDVFTQDDFTTQTTVVFMREQETQHITVV